MNIKDLNDHLDAIEAIFQESKDGSGNSKDLNNNQEQLQTINRSIAQLERKKIPVPKEIRDLYVALDREVKKLKSPSSGIAEAYDRLLRLVIELGKACGKSPKKDLYLIAKEKRSKALDQNTLEETLIKVLEEMGGSGHEKEIFSRAEKVLCPKFTSVDLEAYKGKTPRWQTNLRRVRKKLVERKVLTQESMKRVWTLK
jgi:hypothetical protein